MTNDQHHAVLIVDDQKETLDPKELSVFLALLEASIVAASKRHLGVDDAANSDALQSAVHAYRRISPLEWNEYFDTDGSDLISIKTISRASPLEITLICVISLLTLAVILSGGKIRVGLDGVEAELPPLGVGIRKLREALGLTGLIQASFSIRTVTIVLTKDEFNLLMQQDPLQKNKGGFQNFLVGLQSRINRTTRTLHLSDTDLERIMRYKANPKKGGFQSRFKRIFGRCFP